ncbi:MAG: signal peptidase I [bacterium]|nr:signal peptidase I [bacterium]
MRLLQRVLYYRPALPGLLIVVGTAVMYVLFSRHVISAGIVRGDSMVPTLIPGGRYFINHYIYHLREPRRGDLVVFVHPLFKDLTVKRVIGVPGDVVEQRGGRFYVNGVLLEEPYVSAGTREGEVSGGYCRWQVPAHRYFLMGDNRAVSTDSRVFGTVAREDIKGLVMWQ